MSNFTYTIDCQPDFAMLNVTIPAGNTLKVEASAMAAMDPHLKMKAKFKGGLSRFLTGENLFINEFSAPEKDGLISISPGPPGEIAHVELNGDTIYLANSAYVASAKEVNVETKWQGLMKGFFGGQGLFLIRCSGQGDLWFNSYGGMTAVDVEGEYIVDNSHIVAFTDGLDYNVTTIGGYKSFFFSGEGLVCRFNGKGRVWIQARQVPAFAGWIHPYRPQKSNNN
jgi:uncharacterized protein (TIGR00266 family)